MLGRMTGLMAAVGVAAVSHAQVPAGSAGPPIGLPIRQTFHVSDEGWVAMGDGAKISVATDLVKLNSVNGALKLDYSIGPGKMGLFALPVADGALTGAQSFHFAVRSDYSTNMILGMQENGGGRYMATFFVPANKWQIVELSPSDFALADGPADPKDPDGKLDLDLVQGLGVADAGALWAQANNTTLNDIFGVKTGEHSAYVADFQVGKTPLAAATAPTDVLDTFSHPQVDWLMLGGAQGKHISGAPLAGRGIQVTYPQAPGKLAGFLRPLSAGRLTGATKLSLSLASVKATTLLLQVEEKGGGKYNTTVFVPAGAAGASTITVSFADFKAADDSKDTNGKLDLDEVNRLMIVDVSGIKGDVTAESENTLSLGDLRVVR
jgi:hypothetical protein